MSLPPIEVDRLARQARAAASRLAGSFPDALADDRRLHRAAVAVTMRLVFLSTAGARGLLTRHDHAIDALSAPLERHAAAHGEPSLAHSHDTWPRLLALTREIHQTHGGALFDPDHPTFPASSPPDDRTVLHLLRAAPSAALRDLGVEQFGQIYEALLDHHERRATGTHYTPPELTASVVRHTLEPLCHHGPAEGLARERWQIRPPAEILALRICDLALGSGAFLIAACRYLAAHLLAALDADPDPTLIPSNIPDREAHARRIVAARCLYGVDRNPTAVEMARLSLWLEVADRNTPFTFLDHALQTGDSLLGLHSPTQLHHFNYFSNHAAPTRGPAVLHALLELARTTGEPADTALAELRVLADVLTSSALHPANPKTLRENTTSALVNELLDCPSQGRKLSRVLTHLAAATTPEARSELLASLRILAQLQYGRDPDGTPRAPLHWPLAFPDVLLRGHAPGFDAIVGNPPFQGGQKITGALGTDYRDLIIKDLAGGRRGTADLCAYFFLRAASLLRTPGQIGLIATNTIAQGDSREVALDHLTSHGLEITRAIASAPWPGAAKLEVSQIWLRKGSWAGERELDHTRVAAISPALTRPGAVRGPPHRLRANADRSFVGSYVLGLGFVLTPDEARALLARNPASRDVIFPYLNGDDLSRSPDQSASRRVIDLRDRSHEDAATHHPECLGRLRLLVHPERQTNNREAYRALWWHHAEKRPRLYRRLEPLERTIVVAQVSKFHNFIIVPARQVFDQKLIVFPTSSTAVLAILQSTLHTAWILEHGSSLETRPVYTPSDCFETFPFPTINNSDLEPLGARFEAHRRDVLRTTGLGLTKTYNLLHDSNHRDPGIAALRELHVEIDRAVARAYGWSDLELEHGFHATRQGPRFTVSEAARRALLDRLLALNHARHADELAAGLHAPRKGKRPSSPAPAPLTRRER